MATGGAFVLRTRSHNPSCSSSSRPTSPDDGKHQEEHGVKPVHLSRDDATFAEVQARHLVALEKRISEEATARREQWKCHISHMRAEFLRLYPVSKQWGSDELLNDPLVATRRGSTDVLDAKKMATLFLEYPASGRCYKLRFDVGGFSPNSIHVLSDGERITVRARLKPDAKGEVVDYVRKIEKPREVDASRLKCLLTSDGILVIEAPAPAIAIPTPTHSPTPLSFHSSPARSCSPCESHGSNTSTTPNIRMGQATFSGGEGERVMSLHVDIGTAFKPKEITVQILKDNILQVKARHEERTSERFNKNKFSKEYELSERIEPYSVRAALHIDEGDLVVGALGKGHVDFSKKTGGDHFTNGGEAEACNVLDLATFPPVAL